jgi:hypothetical protein
MAGDETGRKWLQSTTAIDSSISTLRIRAFEQKEGGEDKENGR